MSDYADNLRKSIINTGKKFTEMAEEVRRKQNEADREEILRMARDAGLHLYVNDIAEEPYALRLERFAALVAAAEREACAKVCEETTASWTQHLYNDGCVDCAKAIRARGKE